MNECHPPQGLSEARRGREFPENFPSESVVKEPPSMSEAFLIKSREKWLSRNGHEHE